MLGERRYPAGYNGQQPDPNEKNFRIEENEVRPDGGDSKNCPHESVITIQVAQRRQCYDAVWQDRTERCEAAFVSPSQAHKERQIRV